MLEEDVSKVFIFGMSIDIVVVREIDNNPSSVVIYNYTCTTIEHDGCSAQGCALIAYTIATIYLSICTHTHTV